VKDIVFGVLDSEPGYFTDVGGQIFFVASEGGSGHELWASDGTEAERGS
jgi:hypothetical protein